MVTVQLDVPHRLSAASLVVVDEAERIGQAVHLREQIVVVEIGPAMQEGDRLPLANFANI
jgi:hypothetical protein